MCIRDSVGIANGDLGYIVQRGIILVAMAMLALFFGVQAGNMAAVAAAGYAKNLRHDIFYKVQDFSFKNIDHFSTSGLVTRMTTDITNVQDVYKRQSFNFFVCRKSFSTGFTHSPSPD